MTPYATAKPAENPGNEGLNSWRKWPRRRAAEGVTLSPAVSQTWFEKATSERFWIEMSMPNPLSEALHKYPFWYNDRTAHLGKLWCRSIAKLLKCELCLFCSATLRNYRKRRPGFGTRSDTVK